MAEPGQELYRLLAESNTRASHCLSMGKAAASTLEKRHQAMVAEMQQLREAIASQGLGRDPDSEDRYIELLQDFRQIHQSQALSAQLPEPPSPPMDEALQKALLYGQMLRDIYRDRLLVKGALPDLLEQGQRLRRHQCSAAIQLAEELE
ncbi:MAG: hypothetical protein O3A14_00525, partial [Cyanobacteria bacterium]|nr:hypothetical protein [Cyanobacteriota bacterium]